MKRFTITGLLLAAGLMVCAASPSAQAEITVRMDNATVAHKAFIEVNEEGTKAAAATGIGMVPTAMPAEPRPRASSAPITRFCS